MPKKENPELIEEAVEITEDDSRDEFPEPQEDGDAQTGDMEPFRFFFIAAVKVLWVRDKKPKERTVNVMLNLVVPYITQNTLNDINRAACGRVMAENKVPGEDIREAIVMNVSILGQMTERTFREEVAHSAQTDENLQTLQ